MANNHKVKSNTIIEETFMWTSILRNAKYRFLLVYCKLSKIHKYFPS